MSTKYIDAKPDDQFWTPEKDRCWNLLVRWCGGEHHLRRVVHWGFGLRMTWLSEVATFDSDALTRLVLLAHDRRCRVAISPASPRQISIEVHARKEQGRLCERHPGLLDILPPTAEIGENQQ